MMSQDWIDYSRDPKDRIFNKKNRFQHGLLWLSMLCMLGALLWAQLTYLDEITRSDLSRVIPSSEMQLVQSLDGGIIKNIYVKEGQYVDESQVLADIDDTTAKSKCIQNELQIHALKLRSLRLKAESQAVDFHIPADLRNKNARAADQEENLFLSRKEDLGLKRKVLLEDIDQTQKHYQEEEASLKQHERELTLRIKEKDMMISLKGNGAVSKKELIDIERIVNELQGVIEQKEIRLTKLTSQKNQSQHKLKELLNSFKKEAQDEYNKTKLHLSQLLEENIDLAYKVSRSQLRSPVRGVINKVFSHTQGGVLRSGETLLEIVPLDDTLLIEAKIQPKDIGFIHQGMPAHVKITAYDFSLYGGIDGVVEVISPDVVSERDQKFYIVKIRTDKPYLERFGQSYPIIPGMSATVDIMTGKKTVMSYLLKPILKAQQRALTER